jgi:glycosyltransferase involved in cell wall biosynthesis
MAAIPGIIYPPTLEFDYLVQRPQQLLKALSGLGVTIYYIEPLTLHSRKVKAIERYNQHLYVFRGEEPCYPCHIRPVVYYSNPTQLPALGRYNPGLLVFDSLDAAEDEFAFWEPFYYQAVASADLVLASSDKLYLRAREINPATILLPNACDYDYFSRAQTDARIPADLIELEQDVIGYVGVIASWCDLELLDRVALEFPDCTLLMIGPLYNVHNIPLRSNLQWLGYKGYGELIRYVRCFDVGIIPFKISSLTEAVNPIKMWEYMAMGLPVVTTALPEAGKYGDIIYHASGPEEFIKLIRQALKDKDVTRRERRMALARENSWEVRARQMLEAMTERLDAKGVMAGKSLPIPPEASVYRPRYHRASSQVKYTKVRKHALALSGGII